MKANVQLSFEDYLAAQRLTMQPARWVTFALILLFLFAVLGAILGVVAAARGDSSLLMMMVPAAALSVGVLLNQYVILPRRLRHLFSQQKDIRAPFEIELTPEAFQTTSATGHARRPWTDFVTWRENQNLFVLYYADNLFAIVPKRAFAEPNAVETIRGYLQAANVRNIQPSRSAMPCVVYLVVLLLIVVLLFQFRAASMP